MITVISVVCIAVLAILAYQDVTDRKIPFPSAFETMDEYRKKYLR